MFGWNFLIKTSKKNSETKLEAVDKLFYALVSSCIFLLLFRTVPNLWVLK